MSPVLPNRLGHRMSSLPVTQFCGQAGALSQIGAGRAAAQSTAFHALCSGAENAQELCMRLTEEELGEMMAWHRPADIDLGQGIVLRYRDAMKEFHVAIDKYGQYVEPGSPEAVSEGHPDFAWIVTTPGRKLAYVADIKRSEWTAADGVKSLQLHGYGLAVATKYECDGYCVGIWSAIEGLWQWSELLDLESSETLGTARRVVAAAQNFSADYAMGAHCRSCYGRLRCPAWLIPPRAALDELSPIANSETPITEENALKLLLTFQRVADTAKAVENHLKEWAVRNRGITDPKSGKVWKPVVCSGRESVKLEELRAFIAESRAEFVSLRSVASLIRKGKPYEQFRWVNK